MKTLIKRKAVAYVTHGHQLLVFRHVGIPEAGIQVPAGSIKPREAPRAAAMREAWEETGLTNLAFVSFLGEQMQDMRDFGKEERHHRFFYHLRCTREPPREWQHTEMYNSESAAHPIFALFWVTLSHVTPPLMAGQGAMVPLLLNSIMK